jgi:hypothetical protein
LQINVPPFGRYDPLGHCIVADYREQSTCRNARTAPAALKSP